MTVSKDVLCEMKGRPPLGSSGLCPRTQGTLPTERGTFFFPYQPQVVRKLLQASAQSALWNVGRAWTDHLLNRNPRTDMGRCCLRCSPRLPSSPASKTGVDNLLGVQVRSTKRIVNATDRPTTRFKSRVYLDTKKEARCEMATPSMKTLFK